MNPSAPSRVTSTASRTVPKPVMTMAMMSGIAGEGLVEDLPAVDAGQAEVGDEDVERELVQPLEGFFAGAGLLDAESVLGQPLGDRPRGSAASSSTSRRCWMAVSVIERVTVF